MWTSDRTKADEWGSRGRQTGGRWRWIGGIAGVLVLGWVLRDLDLRRFARILADAEVGPLLLLPTVVVAEQLLRALKWQQLMQPIRTVGIVRLFGAIMAGYFVNTVMPVRVGALVRAWLIAQLEGLRASTVLATVTLDRLFDGAVFVGLGALVVGTVEFPDETGAVRAAILRGVLGGAIMLTAVTFGLVALRECLQRRTRIPETVLRWVPERLSPALAAFSRHFAAGVVLPLALPRLLIIVGASVAMKIGAASHFLLAGLGFGVELDLSAYLFLMVFLGYLSALTGALQLIGGFTAGAVLALGLFGVDQETALAMALLVEAANHLTPVVIGAFALWLEGVSVSSLKHWRSRTGC